MVSERMNLIFVIIVGVASASYEVVGFGAWALLAGELIGVDVGEPSSVDGKYRRVLSRRVFFCTQYNSMCA